MKQMLEMFTEPFTTVKQVSTY